MGWGARNVVHFKMGYYIRVLGVRDPEVSLADLSAALHTAGLAATLKEVRGRPGGVVGEAPAGGRWVKTVVSDANGGLLAEIERNPVAPGEFGQQELAEFRELIRGEEPQSAVRWLSDYFERVVVIYAFRILDAAYEDNNYEIIIALRSAIWERTGGLLQSDGEGFSNEGGYHILWQWDESVSGDRYCAVLDEEGEWQRFRMDLGDHFQRMAFRAGLVPQMAVRL